VILLAEHDEPSLAAKKKRRPVALETATSPPKNRVWDFENTPLGRSVVEPQISYETATGSVQFSYETASGRGYYYTSDHLGSTREVCNSSGTILTRYTYDPYGRATPNYLSGSINATKQYAGYYFHSTSGLNLTYYRAYDSNTSKWLSRDPVGEPEHVFYLSSMGKLVSRLTPSAEAEAETLIGPNLYQYCGNDPADYTDMMGLDFNSWNACFLQCLKDNGWFELAEQLPIPTPAVTTTYLGPNDKTKPFRSGNPNTTVLSDYQHRGVLSKGARALGRVLNPVADTYAAYLSARMLGIEIACGGICSCSKK
jgi:RHS repeat-associated protein